MAGAVTVQLATAESMASGRRVSASCAQPATATPLSKNVTVPAGLIILTSAVSVVVRPAMIGGSGVAATVTTAAFVATACNKLALA